METGNFFFYNLHELHKEPEVWAEVYNFSFYLKRWHFVYSAKCVDRIHVNQNNCQNFLSTPASKLIETIIKYSCWKHVLFFCVKHTFNTCGQVPCVLVVISYIEELHTLYILYSKDNKGSNYKHVKYLRHGILICRKVCICYLFQYKKWWGGYQYTKHWMWYIAVI